MGGYLTGAASTLAGFLTLEARAGKANLLAIAALGKASEDFGSVVRICAAGQAITGMDYPVLLRA